MSILAWPSPLSPGVPLCLPASCLPTSHPTQNLELVHQRDEALAAAAAAAEQQGGLGGVVESLEEAKLARMQALAAIEDSSVPVSPKGEGE